MNIVSLKDRTRSLVRDLNGVYFADSDLRNYVNEAIDRTKQIIPELRGMTYLYTATDELIIMPEEWHHLYAVYCASRLCTQDERFYQAGTFMNEFEQKLMELKASYDSGETEFIDPVTGKRIKPIVHNSIVKNVYFPDRYGLYPREDDE